MSSGVMDVVCDFFDSGLNSQGLQEPLRAAARLLEADSFHFFGVDLETARPVIDVASPEFMAALPSYWAHFHRVDLRRQKAERLPVGQIHCCADYFSGLEVDRAEIWQDLLLDVGVRYTFGGIVAADRSIEYGLALNIRPGRRPPSTQQRSDARHMFAGLGRAIESHRVGAWRRVARRAEEMAQLESRAIFVLDEGGQLHHFNQAAATLLKDRDLVRVHEGRLCFQSVALPSLLNCLKRLVRSRDRVLRLQAVSPQSAGVTSGRNLALTLVRDHEPGMPVLFCLLVDDLCGAGLDAAALAARYQLSPAEARVACAVAAGLSAPEMSEAFAVSEATVRTQLRQLIEKTAVRNLQGLHRLLARTPDRSGSSRES